MDDSPLIEPADFLRGSVAVLAPHMDDEVLGCGATLCAVAAHNPAHVVYLTDGARSPAPPFPWAQSSSAELPSIRRREARRAMRALGVSDRNLHFLALPDGRLAHHRAALCSALERLIGALRPRFLLVPFRFDQHPDHLAAHRAAVEVVGRSPNDLRIVEYFVYYRSRFVGKRDIRRYIRPGELVFVNTEPLAARKRIALNCYESQTTAYFDWQHRPTLSGALIDEVCGSPEAFVVYSSSLQGGAIFERGSTRVRLAQLLEPRLKRTKDRVLAMVNSGARTVIGSARGRSDEHS